MPRIFLSHTHSDKVTVEPIAEQLRQVFGEENVFYDSWSMRPGDSIIGKMNEGMEAPDFVFFFVSSASLASGMVSLEWQTALHKAAKGQTRLIPVRLDQSSMPALLRNTLYLDMYTNGLEQVTAQIMNVCTNEGTYTPNIQPFSNLVMAFEDGEKPKTFVITVVAEHFVEQNLRFLLTSELPHSSYSIMPQSSGTVTYGGGQIDSLSPDEPNLSGRLIELHSGVLKPGFPLKFLVTHEGPEPILDLHSFRHEFAQNMWRAIPVRSLPKS